MTVPAPRTGSGFCIRSNSRFSYFLTAEHVIQNAKHLRMTIYGPQTEVLPEPTVFREGPNSDLAIVRVATPFVPAIQFDTRERTTNDPVMAVGFPQSIVALFARVAQPAPAFAMGQITVTFSESDWLVFSPNGPVEHGSSGGPLIDPTTAKAVGVVVSKDENSNSIDYGLPVLPVIRPFMIASDMPSVIHDITSNPMLGNWRSTAPASNLVNFGGPPYCSYLAHMTVEDLHFTIDASGIKTAFLQAGMSEKGLDDCPFSPIPENDQLFDYIDGVVTGTSVDLAFAGKPGNQPLSNAQFHGTIGADGSISGNLTFHRVNSAELLNWTIPVPLHLATGP